MLQGVHLIRCYHVICAGIIPRFLWLATSGKSMINERLLVLKGRKIVAYPDIDGYATWIEKLAQFPYHHVTVSSIPQRNAIAKDIEAHIDIADWFIREKLRPVGESIKQHSREFLLAAQYLDPEKADEVEALFADLGMMFMGAEKVEEEGENMPP